jgi:dTDP-glucose pyrophosphorylase
MDINYKFCILAAGKGTRNKAISKLHKGLLPLENKAVLSHIIEKIHESVEIVIAVGYKSNQIKDYLLLIFPERKITYVDVENYENTGSGPGLSLYLCKDHLQCPFVFTSADTMTDENYYFHSVTQNWVGADTVSKTSSSSYCLIDGDQKFNKFYFGSGTNAFIGIAGIFDYELFWNSLSAKNLINGEHQVLNGFNDLKEMSINWFNWYDTGNPDAYMKARNHYNKEIVALKNNEALYIENNKVIKYFSDPNIVTSRIKRTEHLNGTIPKVVKLNDYMYYYDYLDGTTLSSITDETILAKVIPFWFDNLGSKTMRPSLRHKMSEFKRNCQLMYRDKTVDRCQYFADTDLDDIQIINGIKVEPINTMLSKVDWHGIYNQSIPTKFHGDFQPENIIYNGEFNLIDWRDSFGDNIEYGDFYYDLGKLYHALLINGQDVNNRLYKIVLSENSASITHHTRNNLLFLLKELKTFCTTRNYSWENVQLLGILQYLGISSLYQNFQEGEYGRFLFLYGKYLLSKHLNKN